MFEITEKRAKQLPTYTSLFFKVPYKTPELYQLLAQQEIYKTDNDEYEFPTTKLFFLVTEMTKYDDVTFVPYKDKPIEWKKVDNSLFRVKPYSYQLDGINYGLNHSGWLLLDSCGLGKSLQMIYLAETLKREEKLEHCLIVCGINSLKYNWLNEIAKFSTLDCTLLGSHTNSKGCIVSGNVNERCKALENEIKEFFIITNIETLQAHHQVDANGVKKKKKSFIDYYKKSKNKIGMIVLDEAHKVCNPESLGAKALLKMQTPHNIALTGTMIMNKAENAYFPLKWTGNLNCTLTDFRKTYCVYGGFNNKQIVGYKNLDLLKELLDTCSLRRLKEDVLDLPPKTYMIEYVEMGKEQQALYNEVAEGIAKELDLIKGKISIMQEITMNMRLRQVTAFPGIVSSSTTKSAKLERLQDLVEEITAQGDKVVVFCTFKGCVKEIVTRLKEYNPVACTGDNNDDEINVAKTTFQTDTNCKVLVATWQKMGTGHTLTAANYVIFVDTPWTDALFQQSADRIYRIGQDKNCTIITLITKDTYDERVQEIIETKEILSNYILDDVDSEKLKQILTIDTY